MNIEDLREKFKYDLIGKWTSCEGTFINVMNEQWVFFLDGSGVTISNSVMSGEEKEEFHWRKKGLFCIEITYSELDDNPTIWIETKYDFCKIQTKCGIVTALVQLDRDTGKPRSGFGLMEVPLSYDGEVD